MKQTGSDRADGRDEMLSAGTVTAIFVPVLVIAQTAWLVALAWGVFNVVCWMV